MAESRRVRMTKRMLKDSLIEILDREPIHKITVKEICENADVNRTTFYAYYDTIEQLLEDIENDVLEQLPFQDGDSDIASTEELISNLTDFFEYVKSNAILFKLLLFKTDKSAFHRHLMEKVVVKYRSQHLISDSDYSDYEYLFCVNGVIGLMKHWLSNQFPFPPAKLAEMSVRLCTSGGDGTLADFHV